VLLLGLGALHYIRHLLIRQSVFDGTYVPRPTAVED
jgi:hypothetical protein